MGVDLMWGDAAARAGHQVCHVSFEGHRTSAPAATVFVLAPHKMNDMSAVRSCTRAAKVLGRRFPPSSDYVRNLLLRNWYIIAHSTRCYAIGELRDGRVQGGTGWGVEMFLARYDYAAFAPLWLFDTASWMWMQRVTEDIWSPSTPPKPDGWYAGIGTRKYDPRFEDVIRRIYG